jgi:hypothetical protein
MVSDRHDWLVVWLTRRMERDGFLPVYADVRGPTYWLPEGIARITSPIKRPVRPDIVALKLRPRMLAVGEAKTAKDLENSHTSEQLAAMLSMRGPRRIRARVYFAFPRSALAAATRIALSLGLTAALRVNFVPIPDVIVEEGRSR